MKKNILLFTVFLGMAYLTLVSYKTGPANEKFDCTGAETGLGNPSGCSDGDCHSHTATTDILVSLEIDSAGVPVTKYVAGFTYTIKVKGINNTTNNLPKYGFQVCAIKGAVPQVTPQNAGTFQQTGLPAGINFKAPLANFYVTNIVEHNTPLDPTTGTGGQGTVYSTSFNWTAPAAGTGTVSIWMSLNAVNNDDDNTDADKWNKTNVVLQEETAPAALHNVNRLEANVYPNPTLDKLTITLPATGTYLASAYDITGKQQYSGTLSNITNTLDVSSWAPGMYYLHIATEGQQGIIPFIKK